ncbi:MAG: hypothetical protein HY861_01295 [Chlamydiia bacterium]|nr:hypothetical protein [Chlamydiia bacterium]
MDLTMKTIPLIAASLLAMNSMFGQGGMEDALQDPESQLCQQSSDTPENKSKRPLCQPIQPTCQPYICKPEKCGNAQEPQTPSIPAYNGPAEINTGIIGDWNFFSTLSFLYWQPMQDDMRIATEGSLPVSSLFGPKTVDHGKTVNMNFDYKPAFKIAMGMNFRNDDWVGSIEYTRLRSTDAASKTILNNNPTLYNLWGDDPLSTSFVDTPVFNSLGAHFQCKLDFIDAQMERVYFVGQRLTFHSSLGLRAALIAESLLANYSYDGALVTNSSAAVIAFPSSLDAVHRTQSWGIGPRMGLEMDWLLRRGIRIFGSGFADVLYTSYKIQTKTAFLPLISSSGFTAGNSITTTNRDAETGALRTHLDLELGCGWGRYLDYNNMHFDLSAAYGFQVFFNQNMLRLPAYSPSNLYVQGLTITARVDY